ncbi:MAG: hypothetical protein WCR66_10830 [Bacteroidota bacterium]|jgi:hypothetical protein
MKQKLITILLLLFTALILLGINFINDWLLIVIGLFFAGASFLSAGVLLMVRKRSESLAKNNKF